MEAQALLKEKLNEFTNVQLASKHLHNLYERLEKAYEELTRAERVVDIEYFDVLELEKLTITKLFQRVLGNLEQQIEIERQEYLEAVLKLRDIKANIKLLEFEKVVLEEKVLQLPHLKKEVEQMIMLREEEVLKTNHPLRYKIIGLNKELYGCIEMKRELYEAKIAGAKVKLLLNHLLKNMRNIANYGSWGFTAKPVEEQNEMIKDISELFQKFKMSLYTFEDELEDIYHHKSIGLINRLNKFPFISELFYSNLISDWVIKGKLHNSLHQFEGMSDLIQRLIDGLEEESKRNEQREERIQEDKEKLITKY